FATALALDGSLDGSHTVNLRATDLAGNVSGLVSTTFILDAQPPQVTIASPVSGLPTNHNVTVSGRVTDNLSGVASLQAQVDSGPLSHVTFDAAGNYSFVTNLALDGSADGLHSVRFVAADRVGNVSNPFPISFVLDATPPPITAFDLSPGSR